MSVTTHMCRGNFRSSWAAEGSYDFVAEALLNELEVDGFFMEWDDERSGGFEPLRFLPKGEKQVVLGLVTTKRGELESKDELKRRIEEASTYAPLEQLCLSPQCGFSSTVEGNELTRGRAVGEAAPDRRGRAGSLGLTAEHRPRRDVRRLPPARADDAVLEPRLDRGSVPRRAAGRPALRARAARGLGRRARDRLRDRPRRAGARDPAHDGRARQRRRRARDRAREPRAARRRRRPAGPAASRLRAVPRRAGSSGLAGDYPVWVEQPVARAGRSRRDRARVPRGGDASRAGARDRADGRLGARRPTRSARTPRPGACLRAAAADPDAVDALAAFLADGEVAGARRRRGRGRRGDVGGARRARGAARRARVPGVVRRARRVPAGPPALRRLPAGRPAAAAREARAVRRACSSSARRCSASRRTRRGGSPTPGTRIAVVSDDADEVHRSPAELARARAAGRRLPRARGARARSATSRRREPFRAAAGARRRASRCARATCSRRSPSGCRATPSSSRRRRSTGPSCTTGCPPASRSASSAPRWAGSASRSAARPACAWRCRSGRSSRSSATARPSTASRRSGARRTTASASCS